MLSPFARRVAQSGVLPEGGRVLAGCSGGADSLALLLALAELRAAGRCDAVAAHVHHGLRESEADADLAVARDAAAHFGLPFACERVDARAAAARRRRGIEEAARHVRHEALELLRERHGCDVVALAHTADDQAETVLLRLLRGAGAEGLAGMGATSGRLVRPLLALRRREAREHVAAAGLPWASDASNWSPSSARAMVRELLGRLEQALDERVVERLCETASQLRDESAVLEAACDELLRGRVLEERGVEGVPRLRVLDAADIGDAPRGLARRAVRRVLRRARPGEPPPTADAIARALRLFTADAGPRQALLRAATLRREGRDVVLGAPPAARAPDGIVALHGDATPWPGGVVRARGVGSPATSPPGGRRIVVDLDAAGGGLGLRARRPGDRIETGGRPRRVSSLMAERRIPAGSRDAHPLVCLMDRGATIVWLAGHDADPRFLATSDSTHVLELRWDPDDSAAPGTGATP